MILIIKTFPFLWPRKLLLVNNILTLDSCNIISADIERTKTHFEKSDTFWFKILTIGIR